MLANRGDPPAFAERGAVGQIIPYATALATSGLLQRLLAQAADFAPWWTLRDSMRVDGGLTGDKLRLLPLQFMETIDALHRPPRSPEGLRPRGG